MSRFGHELTQLLDGFGIRSDSDLASMAPDRRNLFLTRLYKCFRSGIDSLSAELEQIRGLKLEYQHPPSVAIQETYFKKLVLYCSRFVVTCPIREVSSAIKPSKSKRIDKRERLDSATIRKLRDEGKYVFGDVRANERTHGGEIHVHGRWYVVQRSVLWELIAMVCRLREAIEHGLVDLVPRFPDEDHVLAAALRRSGVAHANFSRESLRRQFSEEGTDFRHWGEAGLLKLYLPHLSGLSMSQLIEIREEDNQSYGAFQRAIENLVLGKTGDFSEKRLEQAMAEVDDGVRDIAAKLKQYRRKRFAVHSAASLEAGAVFLVAFAPREFHPAMATFLSAMAAHLVKLQVDLAHEMATIEANPYYVAWKVARLSEHT